MIEASESTREELSFAEKLQRRSRRLRDRGEFEQAETLLREAIERLSEALDKIDCAGADKVAAPQDLRSLTSALADCWGSLGGVLRRSGNFMAARKAYEQGMSLEQQDRFRLNSSYNQVQWLVLGILLSPDLLLASNQQLRPEMERIETVIQQQIRTDRSRDPWAFSDLGLVRLLLGEEDGAQAAWSRIEGLDPLPAVYSSGLSVLETLRDAVPRHPGLESAVEWFKKRSSSPRS